MQYTHNNLSAVVIYPPEALAATQQAAVLSKNIALARVLTACQPEQKRQKRPIRKVTSAARRDKSNITWSG